MTSISNVALFTLLLHFLPCIWKHQIIDTSLENERFLRPFPSFVLSGCSFEPVAGTTVWQAEVGLKHKGIN